MSPDRLSGFVIWVLLALGGGACSSAPRSVPTPEITKLTPADVYIGEPQGREYEILGTVRTWEEFPTLLDDSFDEQEFRRRCRKAFYQASAKLLKIARENGGNGVVDVRSVVFLADGRREYLPSAECSEDGAEGEALVEGKAIRWKGDGAPKPRPKSRKRRRKKVTSQ